MIPLESILFVCIDLCYYKYLIPLESILFVCITIKLMIPEESNIYRTIYL